MRSIETMRAEATDTATAIALMGQLQPLTQRHARDVLDLLDVLAKLAEALRVVAESTLGSHQHWDYTMQHGAGCELCIEQLRVKAQCRAALAEYQKLMGDSP